MKNRADVHISFTHLPRRFARRMGAVAFAIGLKLLVPTRANTADSRKGPHRIILSFTGRKRLRKNFGKIQEIAQMPNLIEVQRPPMTSSCRSKAGAAAWTRGLRRFSAGLPDQGFLRILAARICDYHFEEPKYDVEECQQRSMTYAAPLKVTLRLIVFDVDQETGAKSVKDIKEQDVYMGDVPFMTDERHLRRQRHRARHRLPDAPLAGRLLRPRQGQDPFVGQAAVRRPRHSLSRLVARLRIRRQGHRPCPHRPPPQAAGDDAALCAGPDPGRDPGLFLRQDRLQAYKDGSWTHAARSDLDAQRQADFDWKNAKTGEVMLEAGAKITVRGLRKLAAKTASRASPSPTRN